MSTRAANDPVVSDDVTPSQDAQPLLRVDSLARSFRLRRDRLRGPRPVVQALRDVSFTVAAGETLGVVGESGSGKSTLGRCILRLVDPDHGTVRFRGTDVTALGASELRAVRPHMAMVFQNPYSSLDPTWTVERIVGEPLAVQRLAAGDERRRLVAAVLDRVGLPAEAIARRPAEFSGGQRQRIAIARALVTDPTLVVCDEAVSSLDVSTRAQVLQLLHDLQAGAGLTYLFISHDLSVVRAVSHRVAVMYLGQIVELGDADAVLGAPAHPYTQALRSAVPTIARSDRGRGRQQRQLIRGEVPSPIAPPAGCSFHVRCPLAMPVCAVETPPLIALDDHRSVACHAVTPTGAAPVTFTPRSKESSA